jgi:hypothetical protein
MKAVSRDVRKISEAIEPPISVTNSSNTVPKAGSKSKPKTGSRSTAPAQRLNENFTDTQLARLSRCVACELSWTARKTVAEKMKHITTCARKNRLDHSTVVALVQAEIDRTPLPHPNSKGKGKAKATLDDPAEPSPRTMLEEVVEGPAPKKKRRNEEVQTTVLQPAVTTAVNRDRFKAIIGNKDLNICAPRSATPSEVINERVTSTSVMPPPSTQVFGASKLAVQKTGLQIGFMGTGMFLEDAIVSNLSQPTKNRPDSGKPEDPPIAQGGPRISVSPSHRDDSPRGYSPRTQHSAHCDLGTTLVDAAVSHLLCG